MLHRILLVLTSAWMVMGCTASTKDGSPANDDLGGKADQQGFGSTPAWCDVFAKYRSADGTETDQVTVGGSYGGGFGGPESDPEAAAVMARFDPGNIVDGKTKVDAQITLTQHRTNEVLAQMRATLTVPVPNEGQEYSLDIPAAYQKLLGTVPDISVVSVRMICSVTSN